MIQLYLKLGLNESSLDSLASSWPRLDKMIQTAKLRIQHRSPKELEYSTHLLMWMFDTIAEGEKDDTDASPETSAPDPADTPDVPFLASRLHQYSEYFPIGNIPELPGATWPEFFSILALSLLESAADARKGRAYIDAKTLEHYSKTIPAFPNQKFWAYGTDCVLAAAEALCYADIHTHAGTVADGLVKKTISDRARKAAGARHAGGNALKQEFLEYDRNNPSRSILQNARMFSSEHAARIEALNLSLDYAPVMLRNYVYVEGKVDKARDKDPDDQA